MDRLFNSLLLFVLLTLLNTGKLRKLKYVTHEQSHRHKLYTSPNIVLTNGWMQKKDTTGRHRTVVLGTSRSRAAPKILSTSGQLQNKDTTGKYTHIIGGWEQPSGVEPIPKKFFDNRPIQKKNREWKVIDSNRWKVIGSWEPQNSMYPTREKLLDSDQIQKKDLRWKSRHVIGRWKVLNDSVLQKYMEKFSLDSKLGKLYGGLKDKVSNNFTLKSNGTHFNLGIAENNSSSNKNFLEIKDGYININSTLNKNVNKSASPVNADFLVMNEKNVTLHTSVGKWLKSIGLADRNSQLIWHIRKEDVPREEKRFTNETCQIKDCLSTKDSNTAVKKNTTEVDTVPLTNTDSRLNETHLKSNDSTKSAIHSNDLVSETSTTESNVLVVSGNNSIKSNSSLDNTKTDYPIVELINGVSTKPNVDTKLYTQVKSKREDGKTSPIHRKVNAKDEEVENEDSGSSDENNSEMLSKNYTNASGENIYSTEKHDHSNQNGDNRKFNNSSEIDVELGSVVDDSSVLKTYDKKMNSSLNFRMRKNHPKKFAVLYTENNSPLKSYSDDEGSGSINVQSTSEAESDQSQKNATNNNLKIIRLGDHDSLAYSLMNLATNSKNRMNSKNHAQKNNMSETEATTHKSHSSDTEGSGHENYMVTPEGNMQENQMAKPELNVTKAKADGHENLMTKTEEEFDAGSTDENPDVPFDVSKFNNESIDSNSSTNSSDLKAMIVEQLKSIEKTKDMSSNESESESDLIKVHANKRKQNLIDPTFQTENQKLTTTTMETDNEEHIGKTTLKTYNGDKSDSISQPDNKELLNSTSKLDQEVNPAAQINHENHATSASQTNNENQFISKSQTENANISTSQKLKEDQLSSSDSAQQPYSTLQIRTNGQLNYTSQAGNNRKQWTSSSQEKQTDSISGSDKESQVHSTTQPGSEKLTDSISESDKESQVHSTTQPGIEKQTDSISESDKESQVHPTTQPGSEKQTDSISQSDKESQVHSTTQPGSEKQTDSISESDKESQVHSTTQHGSEKQTDSISQSDKESEVHSTTQPGSEKQTSSTHHGVRSNYTSHTYNEEQVNSTLQTGNEGQISSTLQNDTENQSNSASLHAKEKQRSSASQPDKEEHPFSTSQKDNEKQLHSTLPPDNDKRHSTSQPDEENQSTSTPEKENEKQTNIASVSDKETQITASSIYNKKQITSLLQRDIGKQTLPTSQSYIETQTTSTSKKDDKKSSSQTDNDEQLISQLKSTNDTSKAKIHEEDSTYANDDDSSLETDPDESNNYIEKDLNANINTTEESNTYATKSGDASNVKIDGKENRDVRGANISYISNNFRTRDEPREREEPRERDVFNENNFTKDLTNVDKFTSKENNSTTTKAHTDEGHSTPALRVEHKSHIVQSSPENSTTIESRKWRLSIDKHTNNDSLSLNHKYPNNVNNLTKNSDIVKENTSRLNQHSSKINTLNVVSNANIYYPTKLYSHGDNKNSVKLLKDRILLFQDTSSNDGFQEHQHDYGSGVSDYTDASGYPNDNDIGAELIHTKGTKYIITNTSSNGKIHANKDLLVSDFHEVGLGAKEDKSPHVSAGGKPPTANKNERENENSDSIPKLIDIATIDNRLCTMATKLTVKYRSVNNSLETIDCGANYNYSNLFDYPPDITLDRANINGIYTLLMLDADAPSAFYPVARCTVHWMVVNIMEADVRHGTEVVRYKKPNPPTTTGPHRYVFLLLKQREIEPIESFRINDCNLDVNKFAAKHNITYIEGFKYFTTQSKIDYLVLTQHHVL